MARLIPDKEILSNNNLSIISAVESKIGRFCGSSINYLLQTLHLNLGLPLWIRPFLMVLSEWHLGKIIFFSNLISELNYIL